MIVTSPAVLLVAAHGHMSPWFLLILVPMVAFMVMVTIDQ